MARGPVLFMLALALGAAFAAALEREPKQPLISALRRAADGGGVLSHLEVKLSDALLHNDAAHADVLSRIASAIGSTAHPRRIFRDSSLHEARNRAKGLHLWFELDLEEAHQHLGRDSEESRRRKGHATVDAVELLRNHPTLAEHIHIASPKIQTKMHAYSPDDPELFLQTHYDAISLPDAWAITAGNPSVVVQVIDAGVNEDHPDMQVNKWVNSGETCDDGLDNDNNGFVDDCYGYNFADGSSSLAGDGNHGAHCAGTVAADSDNNVGVAGVAGGKNGSPGASIMTATVFGQSNVGGFSQALVYGADNGAHVSSNSWGYTSPGVYDSSVLTAIDYAVDAGVYVVVAAGNDNSDDEWYPAFYEPSIAVAALYDSGVRASFSNYGSWIDISAPGVSVYSTYFDGYGYMSGTSMACPHVSGILALALSLSPNVAVSDLLACMSSTAVDVDSINPGYEGKLGPGLIDPTAILECLEPPTPAPTDSGPRPTDAPVFAPTPSPTIDCGSCDFTLNLNLLTDNYPQETSWSLRSETDDCPMSILGGGYTSQLTTYTEVVSTQLCRDAQYKFTMRDSANDGICCGYGSGNYALDIDGISLHSSDGNFGSADEVTFAPGDLFGAPSSEPTAAGSRPTGAPVVPPTPSPTIPAPSAAPVPEPTPTPTLVPPTGNPVPAPTLHPTINCGGCDIPMNLTLVTDLYPSEISWQLDSETPLCELQVLSPPYTESSSTYEQIITNALCADATYTFTIYDSFADGICCNYGRGSYSISVNGMVVHSSNGKYGAGESTTFAAGQYTFPPTPAPSTAAPSSLPTRAPGSLYDDFREFDGDVWHELPTGLSYDSGILVVDGTDVLMRSVETFSVTSIWASFVTSAAVQGSAVAVSSGCENAFFVMSTVDDLDWTYSNTVGSVKFAWYCNVKYIYGQFNTVDYNCGASPTEMDFSVAANDVKVDFSDSECGTLTLNDDIGASFVYTYLGGSCDAAGGCSGGWTYFEVNDGDSGNSATDESDSTGVIIGSVVAALFVVGAVCSYGMVRSRGHKTMLEQAQRNGVGLTMPSLSARFVGFGETPSTHQAIPHKSTELVEPEFASASDLEFTSLPVTVQAELLE